MTDRPTRRRVLAGAAGLAAGLAGCSSGYSPRSTTSSPGGGNETGPAEGKTLETDSPYARVYQQVAPAVVRVRVAGARGAGQGSGAVLGPRRIVTNQHVVAGADHVSVAYGDGEYATASVAGADAYSDLAVLTPAADLGHLPSLEFATADPAVGTEVVAVGTPFGLGDSLSAGVVSGVDRALPGPNEFRIPDAIQTDAPANPGNSGGPLVALDGTPLGLVNSGAGNDITFAVSGALMSRVVPALAQRGSYEHSYLGISLRDLSPPLARANDLDTLRGVYVTAAFPGGPAAGALQGNDGRTTALGERVPTGGDVIVALDGTPTPDSGVLGTYLALHTRPGDDVEVTVLRDGQRRTVTVTLARRPPA